MYWTGGFSMRWTLALAILLLAGLTACASQSATPASSNPGAAPPVLSVAAGPLPEAAASSPQSMSALPDATAPSPDVAVRRVKTPDACDHFSDCVPTKDRAACRARSRGDERPDANAGPICGCVEGRCAVRQVEP